MYWTEALTNWSNAGLEFSGIWLDMNEVSSFCNGSWCGALRVYAQHFADRAAAELVQTGQTRPCRSFCRGILDARSSSILKGELIPSGKVGPNSTSDQL